MRFMMLMIPAVYRADAKAPADFTPDPEAVRQMTAYNERLVQAGTMLAGEGLHAPAEAARVSFEGGVPRVTDGPFVETREALGGYWIIRADSRAQAIEWARQVPAAQGDIVEVRQIFEPDEFPEAVREAADSPILKKAFPDNGGERR